MSLLHHTWVWSSSDVIVSLCKAAAKASSGKTCLWASRCGQKRFSCVAAVLEWQSLMQSFCQPTSHLERSIHCSSSRYIWLMVNRKVGTIPPRTTPSSQRQWILHVSYTSPCSTIDASYIRSWILNCRGCIQRGQTQPTNSSVSALLTVFKGATKCQACRQYGLHQCDRYFLAAQQLIEMDTHITVTCKN